MSKDRTYIVSSGAVLHMMERKFSLSSPQEKKSIRQTNKLFRDPKCDWNRSFHNRCEGLLPGARHLIARARGGRFAFSIVSWAIVRRTGVFLFWATRRTPDTDKRQKTVTCCTDNFVPLAAVTPQMVTPSIRHDSCQGKPCARYSRGGNHAKRAGTFL